MLELGKSSYKCLIEAFSSIEKIVNQPDLLAEFREALDSDAFKRRQIKHEAIFKQDKVLAYEVLSRPHNGERAFSIGHLSELSHRLDVAKEFDALTCANALQVAKETPMMKPITLNISVESAISYNFWNFMGEKLEQHKPEDLIFEILENNVNLDADITHLNAFKDRGYRFALDDYSIGEDHDNRLHVFGNLVDFIKIDGPFVRAGLGDTDTEFSQEQFNETIQQLKDKHPDVNLIAERVYNREEAQYLFDMGFTGVQGWDLKPEDFTTSVKNKELDTKPYTNEELTL